MKLNLLFKRVMAVLIASTLLASTVWGQPSPNKPPREVIGGGPIFNNPIDINLPLIVSIPQIQFPADNAEIDMSKDLVISGKSMGSGRLQVTVKSEWLVKQGNTERRMTDTVYDDFVYPDSRADSSGNWRTEPIKLKVPANAQSLKYEITAVHRIGRNESKPTTITVRPALVMLALPPPVVIATAAPMLSITTPKDGAKVAAKAKQIILKGTASFVDAKETIEVQMTMYVTTERGNFLSGKQRGTRQIHRRVDNVPIKNGKWETPLNISTNAERITNVTYDIHVSLTKNGSSRRIKLSR